MEGSNIMRVKVGDLVSHTMDIGPSGAALVLSVDPKQRMVECKFPRAKEPRWYHTRVLYVHGKD